jgi:hypothetical protein
MERSGTLKLKKFLSKLQTNIIDERAKKTTELLLMNYMNRKLPGRGSAPTERKDERKRACRGSFLDDRSKRAGV